jgi:hypothetical protein
MFGSVSPRAASFAAAGAILIEPRPLEFGEDWSDQLDGVPVIESVLHAFVGRCKECGCPAEEQRDGAILIRPVVVEGTLYGDTFCCGCIDPEVVPGPGFVLPPFPGAAESAEEGGE